MVAADFDYLATRNEIIQDALEIVGVCEAEQSPTAEQLVQASKGLQSIIKHWSNKHSFLWSLDIGLISTVAATDNYVVAAGLDAAIGLEKAWYVNSNQYIPLEVISYSEFVSIEDHENSSGIPKRIAFRPLPSPSYYLDPIPDAAYVVRLLAVQSLEDMDSAGGSGDIPARFQMALTYALAVRLYDKYPADMNRMQWVAQQAKNFFTEASRRDVSTPTTEEIASAFPMSRCR